MQKSPRLRRTQRVAIFMLTLAGCINYLHRSALSVANNMIRGEMGLSASEMGVLLSAFSMAYGGMNKVRVYALQCISSTRKPTCRSCVPLWARRSATVDRDGMATGSGTCDGFIFHDLKFKQYLACARNRTDPGTDFLSVGFRTLGLQDFQCLLRAIKVHPEHSFCVS
ncbi:hypothetical protein [Paraburkholderia terrae]